MNILQNDFQYNVDYDTESYDEEDDPTSDYHRYYRKITSVTINSVNYKSILEKILPNSSKKNPVEVDALALYILDRYLHIHLKPEDFEAEWGSDYYGDSVRAVKLSKAKLAELNDFISRLSAAKKLTKFIREILIDEYGFLLPEIEEIKEWELIEVNKSEVDITHTEYVRHLDKQRIKWYADNNKIQSCLCLYRHGKLRLIDGYHRFAAAKGRISVVCPKGKT